MMTLIADFGMDLNATVHKDAPAAICIVRRTGLGKLRHLNVKYLWLQEHLNGDTMKLQKVAGEQNPADMVTKHLNVTSARRHFESLGIWAGEGCAESAQNCSALTQ